MLADRHTPADSAQAGGAGRNRAGRPALSAAGAAGRMGRPRLQLCELPRRDGRRRPERHLCEINYEEGAESAIMHGDPAAEAFLSEWIGAQPTLGLRNMNMESLYEYGSRAGFWRLYRAFTERSLPVTVYAVAMALERNPPAVAAMVEADWEIATHGYRWIDYPYVAESVERQHIAKACEPHTSATA